MYAEGVYDSLMAIYDSFTSNCGAGRTDPIYQSCSAQLGLKFSNNLENSCLSKGKEYGSC